MTCIHTQYRNYLLKPSNLGRLLIILGLGLFLGLHSTSPSAAQELDGNALGNLALQGTWAAQDKNYGYWSWGEDKSVCFRLFEPKGDCADTGTWTIDDNVMCYELSWWGESYQIRKNCFTVVPLEDGLYDALYHESAVGSTFIKFEVLE